MKARIEQAVEKHKNSAIMTVSPLGDDSGGFYVPLGMFHYQIDGRDELMVFELEINKDASAYSMRVSFCENNECTDCWEVQYINHKKLDNLMPLFSIAEKSSEAAIKTLSYDRTSAQQTAKEIYLLVEEVRKDIQRLRCSTKLDA
jgi:hypothetical protein